MTHKKMDQTSAQNIKENNPVNAIILAAGCGKRMKSKKNKVLWSVCGSPMIEIVLNKLNDNDNKIIVASECNKDEIEKLTKTMQNTRIVIQKERLGTGHAVLQAMPLIDKSIDKTVVLYGDTPLLKKSSITEVISSVNEKNIISLLLFKSTQDNKYGQIRVDFESKKALESNITEYGDDGWLGIPCTTLESEERSNLMQNSGIMSFSTNHLLNNIINIKPSSNGEIRLTDILSVSKFCPTFVTCEEKQSIGVNNKKELSVAENLYQECIRDHMMIECGVACINPDTIFFSNDTKIGEDTILHSNIKFENKVEIGENCKIGSNVVIENCKIGDNVVIVGNLHISNSIIGNNCTIKNFCNIDGLTAQNKVNIGPFANIRPETVAKSNAKIGSFVDVKNSQLNSGAKVAHLSYIGDAAIGENTNIGAMVVTCNYDGIGKNKTTIGKNVFVGSSSSIVAPILIEDECFIGAGSLVRKSLAKNDFFAAKKDIFQTYPNKASFFRKNK